MLRERTIRVFIHNSLCHFTDILQQLSVAGYIRYFQIKGNAALLGSFQITRPAKFQISFGYLETIVRTYHNLQTFPGIFRQFITGHQNTIRLVGSAPYTTTELMKLGKSETFGILYYHHGSVRYIHTDFNNRGGNHYLRLAGNEQLHLRILFGGFHFPVHLANLTIGKLLTDMQIAFFQVLEVNLFALLD